MPVWNYEEIKTCRSEIFQNLEKEKINELFLKWKGIPQFVLKNANNVLEQQMLDDAVVTFDKKILSYISESDSSEDISHKLVLLYILS
jgi:hypothetical protein